ncbi:unnamed protein product [Alopecurus aequalis]
MNALEAIPRSAEVQNENLVRGHGQQTPEAHKQCDASALWNSRPGKNIDVIKQRIGGEVNDASEQLLISPQDSNIESAPNAAEHIATSTAYDGGLHVPTDDLNFILENTHDPTDSEDFDLDLPDLDLSYDGPLGLGIDESLFQAWPSTTLGASMPEATPGCSQQETHMVAPGTGATSMLKRSIDDPVEDSIPSSKKMKVIGQDSLVDKSTQLYASVAVVNTQYVPKVDQLRHEIELHRNRLAEAGQPHEEFKVENPVRISLAKDSDSRFINYVRGDIKDLLTLLKNASVNKQRLIREIDIGLKLWEQWFASRRPDVEHLANCLVALREDLTKDPSSLTQEVDSWRDAVSKRVSVVNDYHNEMATTRDSMDRITSTFEKQLSEKELKKLEYSNRTQGIKDHIERLKSELDEVEKEYSHEESLAGDLSRNLSDHRKRHGDVTLICEHLELLLSQDRDWLNQPDKLLDCVKPDESGLSARSRALRDFLMACDIA